MQAALEYAGACESEAAHSARLESEAADAPPSSKLTKAQEAAIAREKEQVELERRAATMSLERVAMYRKLREKAKFGLSLAMLRELRCAKSLQREWMIINVQHRFGM